MPIRNACVAVGDLAANGAVTAYTVPANNVFIVKSVLVTGAASPLPSTIIYIIAPGATRYLGIANLSNASGTAAQWSGWTVLNAGFAIEIYAPNMAISYAVSGAVLPYDASLG